MLDHIGYAAEALNNCLFGITLPLLVLAAGIFFFICLRGAVFLHPVRMLKILIKKDDDAEGASPLKSLSLALAGTLGVGNIAGVTLALMTGGAGSIFWMWVSSFAAMLIKFAEITVAHEFRDKTKSSIIGGAPYYIKNLPGGRYLSVIFAAIVVACSLAMGGVLQSNTVAECFDGLFGVPPIVIGIMMLIPVAIVVSGGGKKISAVTSVVIPILTAAYTVMGLIIIVARIEYLPSVIEKILHSAFDFSAAGGGVLGFLFSKSVQVGISRGLLSNEAGCGTAPIAHAGARTKNSAKQGIYGVIEVFIDTCLLCTVTAFVVLMSLDGTTIGGGMTITALAFAVTFGDAASYIIAASVFMFAYSTIICWYYYGETSLHYLTTSKLSGKIFLLLYIAAVPIGAVAAPDAVWKLNDLMVSLMCTINVSAVLVYHGLIRKRAEECGLIIQKTPLSEPPLSPRLYQKAKGTGSHSRCRRKQEVLCRVQQGRDRRET